jgi:AraC family transcriptional regulator
MDPSNRVITTVEAELRTAVATAQRVHFEMLAGIDHILRDEGVFRLDLCLTPRPPEARACYPDRSGPQRFERIGAMFLLPPGEVMHARSEGGTQTSVVCRIAPELISKWLDRDLPWTEDRLEACLDIQDQSIHCHMMRLTRELSQPGFASEMLLELIASQLAIELGRYCAPVKGRTTQRGLAAWRLRLIDERVKELGKPPSLAELARLCDVSVRQLSRGFRISRGCSIGHHVEQARIENAKRLLSAGKSVKAVAYSMGFASPSSFSYAFHRVTGYGPAHFRQSAYRAPLENFSGKNKKVVFSAGSKAAIR